MDLSQLQEWRADPQLKQSTLEKAAIFRRMVITLFALIAGTFALMLWVLSYGDSYQEHQAAAGPSSTWPDGSAKTGQDWWATAHGHSTRQVAQPPSAPSPTQPSPNRG